jgi:hypothetical protein
MKTIIAGSRHTRLSVRELDAIVADAGFDVTEVVCGCADGVDKSGERWAKARGKLVRHFPADWSLGKRAGPLRNSQMVEHAEALIAIPAIDSRGTWDVVKKAEARGLKVYVKRPGR